MNVCAIIQARTGSTRLPGKVLLPLAGKSMLQNIVERVKRAKRVDQVIVSVPGGGDGVALSGDWTIHVDFGDENDLIGRYYSAARMYGADLIVRICADNPCVEPGEIDRAVEYWHGVPDTRHLPSFVSNMHQHKPEFMMEQSYGRLNGYPDGIGCEVFSFSRLKMMNEHFWKKGWREHPHLFFHEQGMVSSPRCPEEFSRPNLKLDVNTKEEYEYIKDIYDYFGHNNFHITEVIKYLDSKNKS